MRADNGDLPRVAVVPVTLLLLIALMTACGSSQSGSSASAHLETPTSQTSATPIVTADPGDPTLLPVPADVRVPAGTHRHPERMAHVLRDRCDHGGSQQHGALHASGDAAGG